MPYSPSGSSPWYGNNPPTSLYGPGRDEQGRVIPFSERGRPPLPSLSLTPQSPSSAPNLPDYSGIDQIIQQINSTNQRAQLASNASRIPMAPQIEAARSNAAFNLLNPPDTYGEMDVPSAAAAVASGTVGSPFAGHYGLKLTREQQQRDIALGSNIANQAYAANPGFTPADPLSLVSLISQQIYGAGQNQLDRDQRERIENARMANQALQNRRNIQAYNNRSYGPTLPTDYGSPGMGAGVVGGAQTNIPEDPNRFGPYELPKVSPNIGGLENWSQMNRWQQDDYNRMLGQNPYYGLPDWQNPYSGDDPMPAYDPPAPLLEDYY